MDRRSVLALGASATAAPLLFSAAQAAAKKEYGPDEGTGAVAKPLKILWFESSRSTPKFIAIEEPA